MLIGLIRRLLGVQYVCLDPAESESKSGEVVGIVTCGTALGQDLAELNRSPTPTGLIRKNVQRERVSAI